MRVTNRFKKGHKFKIIFGPFLASWPCPCPTQGISIINQQMKRSINGCPGSHAECGTYSPLSSKDVEGKDVLIAKECSCSFDTLVEPVG